MTLPVGPAGHFFDAHGLCSCGRTIRHLLDRQDQWEVGKPDIAHTGALNAAEVDQLVEWRDRPFQQVSYVAGGSR